MAQLYPFSSHPFPSTFLVHSTLPVYSVVRKTDRILADSAGSKEAFDGRHHRVV